MNFWCVCVYVCVCVCVCVCVYICLLEEDKLTPKGKLVDQTRSHPCVGS